MQQLLQLSGAAAVSVSPLASLVILQTPLFDFPKEL